MNTPEISPAADSSSETVRQELNMLRHVINAAILLMLVIGLSLDFFFYKQVTGLKFQIANSEKQLKAASEEFERSYKPMAGVFVQSLVGFAQRYPDFAPILAKYQIPTVPAAAPTLGK